MKKPLAGIKVLSFELQVAGPYCTMMLAYQGAIGRPDLVDHEGTTSGPERAKNMTGWLGEIIADGSAARPRPKPRTDCLPPACLLAWCRMHRRSSNVRTSRRDRR